MLKQKQPKIFKKKILHSVAARHLKNVGKEATKGCKSQLYN